MENTEVNQYLGIAELLTNPQNVNNSIERRQRGLVKPVRKSKKDGWVDRKHLYTTLNWAYKDIKDWAFKSVPCGNCGAVHMVPVEDSLTFIHGVAGWDNTIDDFSLIPFQSGSG